MKKFYAVLAMLIATVLWGFAFSAQANGMKHVGALLFVALRSVVGVAALAGVIIVVELLKYRKYLSLVMQKQCKQENLCFMAVYFAV